MPVAVRVLVGVAALAFAAGITACSSSVGGGALVTTAAPATTVRSTSTSAPTGGRRVALLGDSLAWEAEPFFRSELEAQGVTVETDTAGGTAICDFLTIAQDVATRFRPDTVVISFVGNRFSTCTKAPDGKELSDNAFVALYKANAETVTSIFASVGAVTWWAGSPPLKGDKAGSPFKKIFAMYKSLPSDLPTARFVDAGAAVTQNGAFTAKLPCSVGEVCTGSGGENPVRAPDGVHFCPAGYDATTRCAVWSSGAWRYAKALAGVVLSS